MKGMKQDFPEMPESMRRMVEQEVVRQLEKEGTQKTGERTMPTVYRGRKLFWKKTSVVGLAAAMALGVTVFAGVTAHRIWSEKSGTYAVDTVLQIPDEEVTGENLVEAEQTVEAGSKDGSAAKALQIPAVELVYNYIPDGMIQPESDPLKLFYEDNAWKGGLSAFLLAMNEDTDAGAVKRDLGITSSENLELAGHDAVYLESAISGFNKRMYIVYPEVSYIVELYGADDVSKEEMINVAENLELRETGEMLDLEDVWTWKNEAELVEDDSTVEALRSIPEEDMMKNLKQIGESVQTESSAFINDEYGWTDRLEAKVTDVSVSDDLSSLTRTDMIPEDWQKVVNEDGALFRTKREFVKLGDGIDTLDETVASEDVNLKLVTVTMEYTNTGDQDLRNVLFYNALLALTEENGIYRFADEPVEGDNWDYVMYPEVYLSGEMRYYDVTGEEDSNNGSNYLPALAAGETGTVHLAWLVPEDELSQLFLNIGGGTYSFEEEALQRGYVDISQN